jgi:hypothetical protein
MIHELEVAVVPLPLKMEQNLRESFDAVPSEVVHTGILIYNAKSVFVFAEG